LLLVSGAGHSVLRGSADSLLGKELIVGVIIISRAISSALLPLVGCLVAVWAPRESVVCGSCELDRGIIGPSYTKSDVSDVSI
jgi:hypothetical protein